jgi:hypothetical protein
MAIHSLSVLSRRQFLGAAAAATAAAYLNNAKVSGPRAFQFLLWKAAPEGLVAIPGSLL